MLLSDSKQWEAGHGAYLVNNYDFEHNEAQPVFYGSRSFQIGDWPGGTDQLAPTPLNGVTVGISYAAAGIAGVDPTTIAGATFKPIKRDTAGVFFTGLSPQTTLTLTIHEIIETFPTQPSPLVTMARPTPDYDPNFFALYKEVSRNMPPGVMVSENADGGFWDTILDVVSEAAPIIGSLIPGGGAIGSIVGGAAKAGKMLTSKMKDNNFTGTQANTKNQGVVVKPPAKTIPRKAPAPAAPARKPAGNIAGTKFRRTQPLYE
jgi:hypothetical protein